MVDLAQLLSSRVRAEILRLLFGVASEPLHLRELARRSGLNEASIRQELRKLHRMELVVRRADGNRVYWRAHREHPLYPDVHNLVLKTSGLSAVLSEALAGAEISVAFVFGSVAAGTETASSDIDVMAIGKLGLRKLSAFLSTASAKLGREVNPHSMTETEYRRRVRSGEHFVSRVLGGPKIFIVGNEHDLEAMGE